MTKSTIALQNHHQRVSTELLEKLASDIDQCENDTQLAKFLGVELPKAEESDLFAIEKYSSLAKAIGIKLTEADLLRAEQAKANSLQLERLPVLIVFKHLEASVKAGVLAISEKDIEEMTGGVKSPQAIVIERSADGVISNLFSRLPKLAGKYFAKDGTIEAVQPSSKGLKLFFMDDGSMIVKSHSLIGNTDHISSAISALATSVNDLIKPEDEAKMIQSKQEMIDHVSAQFTSEVAKKSVPELTDKFFLDVSLAAFNAQERGITVSYDSTEKLLDAVFKDSINPKTGKWLDGVTGVTLNGKSMNSINELRMALVDPTPTLAAASALNDPEPISLADALARRRAGQSESQTLQENQPQAAPVKKAPRKR